MLNIHEIYQKFLTCGSVSTDSREVKRNTIFFALKGERFDGNRFIPQAFANGAAFAVTDDRTQVRDERVILAENVLETLQKLASHHRKQLGIPIIAITGTNGKTTTKELVTAVLSQKFRTGTTKGNLNNHIGVPLTLLSFTRETNLGIVEMGANHPGEIGNLCRIADPDYGIVTNVGKAHLEGFGNLEGVISTKSELYRYLQQKEKGVVFVNGDNPLLMKATQNIPLKITYGSNKKFHTRGYPVPSVPYLKVRIGEGAGAYEISTRLTGDYNLENVLCAVTVGNWFGVEPLLIKKGIEGYIPSNNRSQLIESGSNTIIMDAYNANPVSMEASIRSFLQLPGKNKSFILGDMLELGHESQAEHQAITDLLSEKGAEMVFLVGEFFTKTVKPDHFLTFANTDELSDHLFKNPIQNQTILIKGSHGIQLEKLLKVFS